MSKLTKRIVDAATPRETGSFFIWCSDLKGFGVRVWSTGKKSYVADYRTRDGERRRLTIGNHGPLTTDDARKQAMLILAEAIKGEDPLVDRATRRNALTLAELCDSYLEAAEKGLILGKGGAPKKASTLEIDRGRVERHIKPLLGRRIVKELTPADLNRFVRDVTAGKTATVEKSEKLRGKVIVRGGAGTASRAVGLLGGILSFAVSEGIIETNPARGVKRAADKKRERRLSPEEYRALGNGLRQAEAEGEPWWATGPVWLLALTGCRRNEIVRLQWSAVDAAGKVLRLSDSKTGASVRPLGDQALKLLNTIPHQNYTSFVFPAPRGNIDAPPRPFGGMQGAWERIRERAELPKDIFLHTLRHSFASVAGDLGLADSTIGAMIGHSSGTVTSRYVHRLDALLVATTDKVVSEIWRQMTGDDIAE